VSAFFAAESVGESYQEFFPGASFFFNGMHMVCIKANIAVRPELVKRRNREFLTFMLRQAQHERSEFSLGTYHCVFSFSWSLKHSQFGKATKT
jgi:hypothetical protein